MHHDIDWDRSGTVGAGHWEVLYLVHGKAVGNCAHPTALKAHTVLFGGDAITVGVLSSNVLKAFPKATKTLTLLWKA